MRTVGEVHHSSPQPPASPISFSQFVWPAYLGGKTETELGDLGWRCKTHTTYWVTRENALPWIWRATLEGETTVIQLNWFLLRAG